MNQDKLVEILLSASRKMTDKTLSSNAEQLILDLGKELANASDLDKTQVESVTSDGVIKIWTDGSCSGNPGVGGWAYILLNGDDEVSQNGGEAHTTNNRMELMAAIKSLGSLGKGSKVELRSDSQYVINGVTKWANKWRRNNWRTSTNQEVANKDLWEILTKLNESHTVSWIHVKGHNNDYYNEKCDLLAKSGWS